MKPNITTRPALLATLLGSSFVVTTTSSQAAVFVDNTSQISVYTVSSTDLLQAAGTTNINRDASENVISDSDALFTYGDNGTISAGVSVLTDGAFGGLGTPPNSQFAGIVGQQAGSSFLSITFALDLTANTFGYDISSVDIYTGWGDGGRDNVTFNLLYSTVAAPTTFISLASVNYTDGTGGPYTTARIFSMIPIPF